jgi:dienelactone hydrolase
MSSGVMRFGWLLFVLFADVTHGADVNRNLASDSLAPLHDSSEDAWECIEGLVWPTAEFEVIWRRTADASQDRIVQFSSAITSGDSVNDRVAMEWYVAADEDGQITYAPAVIVVHESGRRMPVGRLFAKGFQNCGMHAFLVHLPFYGKRAAAGIRPSGDRLIPALRQAVSDVRRARDAVAVLPHVDATHIALQGTSLGGFVAATAASLDDGFDSVFLLLAGGDLYDLLQHGEKDAAKLRDDLAEAGIAGARLKTLLQTIEPTRIAHRLEPDTTWLYSATSDRVVPMKNALALKQSAGLTAAHHVKLAANHYSGIIYVPFVLQHMIANIKAIHAKQASASSDHRPLVRHGDSGG